MTLRSSRKRGTQVSRGTDRSSLRGRKRLKERPKNPLL